MPNDTTPIRPSDVGRNDNTIVPSLDGTKQQVAFALAATGKAREGYTLPELLVRLRAANAPLWSRAVVAGDYNWLSRQPHAPATARGRIGVCHAFDHKGNARTTPCVAQHGSGAGACNASAPNVGDGTRRWRYDGYDAPAFDVSPQATVKAARDNFAAVTGVLLKRFARSRVEATPAVAQLLALDGGAFVLPNARRKAASNAPKRRARKAANVASDAPANAPSGDTGDAPASDAPNDTSD